MRSVRGKEKYRQSERKRMHVRRGRRWQKCRCRSGGGGGDGGACKGVQGTIAVFCVTFLTIELFCGGGDDGHGDGVWLVGAVDGLC